MIPTFTQFNQQLGKLYEAKDKARDKSNNAWTRRTDLLEALSLIPAEERYYKQWNDVCSELHAIMLISKSLDEETNVISNQITEVQHQMRTLYPPTPVKIPKSVINRSKEYDGDDA